MNVCFFGSYEPTYPRNRILSDGLLQNGVGIIECHSCCSSFMLRYWQLFRRFWSMRKKVDVLFVAFVGQLDVPIAWVLAKLTGKKLVFDMYYSMYDTYVYDRKSVQIGSLRAKAYWLIDKIAATLPDVVLTDTNTHADYFVELFGLKRQKFHRVFSGGDSAFFKPLTKRDRKKTIVEFHGMFTRLQGAEIFAQVAKLSENESDIEFWLIGESNIYQEPLRLMEKLKPKNLKYFKALPLARLAEKVRQAHITVGHLGTTRKAYSVISNKTFHGLACGNALVVIDTPANRELFHNGVNALFVKAGNAADSAQKIHYLVKKPALRKKLAKAGHELFTTRLTNEMIGRELKHIFESLR